MTRGHRDELVAHAREDAPDECCGFAYGRDGALVEVVRATNEQPSKMYGFTLDSRALLRANELDDEGYQISVYHSHPRSPARPSQQDINVASYPHWTHLIVSLEAEEAEVRAWRIVDGRVDEEEVTVE